MIGGKAAGPITAQPDEILSSILGHIPFGEWSIICQVCRRWHRLLTALLRRLPNINHRMLKDLDPRGDIAFIRSAVRRWLELWPYVKAFDARVDDDVPYPLTIRAAPFRRFEAMCYTLCRITSHDYAVLKSFYINPRAAMAVFAEMYAAVIAAGDEAAAAGKLQCRYFMRTNKMLLYILIGDSPVYGDGGKLWDSNHAQLSYGIDKLLDIRDDPDDTDYIFCPDYTEDDLLGEFGVNIHKLIAKKDTYTIGEFDEEIAELISEASPAVGNYLQMINFIAARPKFDFADLTDYIEKSIDGGLQPAPTKSSPAPVNIADWLEETSIAHDYDSEGEYIPIGDISERIP